MMNLCGVKKTRIYFKTMYTKKELEQLKEQDYIMWSELTSNPTGTDNNHNNGCLFFVLGVIVTLLVLIYRAL